jgi:3-dehydroquinate synthase
LNTPLKLIVNLEKHTYPIFIGSGLLNCDLLTQYILADQVFVVTNEVIAPLYLSVLNRHLKNYHCDTIILRDGEENKNLATLSTLFDELIMKQHRRSTTLVALGGGVIGDMTGFAAACYQRGVNFIQIPTTLLSQVDASIGGKTGINHPLAKNMIGAFYQPRAVFIDVDTLTTLPGREYKSGIAEIIKAALISDEDFFCWLEWNIEKLVNRDQNAMKYAIQQACAIKIEIVVADEKEANVRTFLNLGHTFAHALEQCLGYGVWLHGEAVAVGLTLAADFSCRLGWLNQSTLERIKKVLTMAGLPIAVPLSISTDQFIKVMNTDKKKECKHLRLVLLKGISEPVVSSGFDLGLLKVTIAENQIKN